MTQSTTTSQTQNDSQQRKYFDLHTMGIGYLNRVRKVSPKKGKPFLAVDIAALNGHADDVHYTRFDCRVYGAKAMEAVTALWTHIENEKDKVLVAFKVGDLYAETFVYQSEAKKGEIGISLKVRLLKITWAKVNNINFPLPGTDVATDGDDDDQSEEVSTVEPVSGDLLPRESSAAVGAGGQLQQAYMQDDRIPYSAVL